ncbi:MAG: elongation factor P maturation arginine rhamnosyltransferase EarP [Candidatus Accumulibacter sp.]|jgi:uncharacterized repeat protein (TIGR03837 family)|nr:elongation factor P maturation arginine rhamnosyltransferase EarP [Accumulibacter sp.]
MRATACLHWDIFCHVVDNFGDIGVCWRLARQLANEHGQAVRLWVDDLAAFRRLCPEIRDDRPRQAALGVEVRRWERDFAGELPGDVVVETFACRLPDAFEAAMARREPKPVWINLEHLSAEAWVADYHALPSPHPRLPLVKYFFFPGFTARTGGLLRENDLEQRRQAFATAHERQRFLARLGVPDMTPADTLLVSLFCYPNAALAGLLDAWSRSERPVLCLAPPASILPELEGFARRRLAEGDTVRAGRLELRLIPFVAQPDYDRLLWSCDLNFVRGEDSFARAQWAARPMVWHIYPQKEDAHHAKLSAFLDAYCAGLPDPPAAALREFTLAWNGIGPLTGESWERWQGFSPALRRHAEEWRKKLNEQRDLCSRLVQFCQSRL